MRSYLPRLKSLEDSGRATLVAAIDLEANRLSLEFYRHTVCPTTEFVYVAPFTTEMPESIAFRMTNLIRRLCISCMIIITKPLAHRVYGTWALELGLNIIMDKPISTREWVVSNLDEAKGIADDF